MSLILKTTVTVEESAEFIADKILKQLELGKKVLWLMPGGSAIAVSVKVAGILRNYKNQNWLSNLTITLTDERYGAVGHKDSNWSQLMEQGFNLPQAKLIPVLFGDDMTPTVLKFSKILDEELKKSDFKIGLFGIGKDGHTAGILPRSGAVDSEDLAFGYQATQFFRLTMTPKAIEYLDEVVVWAQGEDKWSVIKDLKEKEISITEQPAQVLKKVQIVTIFTDYLNG